MRVGRYVLGDRLSQRGVGDVYRGHLHGEEGFRTRLVIKRLRDDTEQHAHYFLNEARLGATLVHQNPRRDSW